MLHHLNTKVIHLERKGQKGVVSEIAAEKLITTDHADNYTLAFL